MRLALRNPAIRFLIGLSLSGIFFICFSGLLRAENSKMVIVALGDSTTAGTPAFRSPAEIPPNGAGDEQSQYAYWLMQRHPEWKVFNRGVNGERTDQILRRFDSDVAAFHPRAVIVLAGVNDLYQGRSEESIEENLKKIYDRSIKQNIPVMACTILPYNASGPLVGQQMKAVNEWIRSTSAARGFGFCDLFHAMEDPTRPGDLISTVEGLHPDIEGYRRMGNALADCLEGWLKVPLPDPQPSFRPSWWCRGPQAQTILGSILRPVISVPLRRERWETPDGDFIDVDWTPGPPSAPILIVLHGLEGSSRSKAVMGLLGAAYRKGWRGLAVNFRSCSGEPNRLRRSYHGGETSDLRWIIGRLIQEDPRRPLLCAGISIGGNVLLKYLGEEGKDLPEPVRAAVAISAPFDLRASALYLEKGFSRIYMRRLVKSLKGKALAKLERYPDLVDRQKLLSARTLKEFDDLVTGPVHGFRDAEAYWAASSSAQFLSKIRRPVLLINARDDPFLPEQSLPEKELSENRFLTAEFPKNGGHGGFLSGFWPGRPIPWAEIRAIHFLEESLARSQGG